ncbi:MAG: hypothetical protein II325_05765 [Clostridia bacterium]|nr:hypothetical protein [Clostridia bacterium]
MKRLMILCLAGILTFACAGMLASAEVVCDEYWQDSFSYAANGEYRCDVPYGYLWEVEDLDGTITGEDATICTTTESYENCNAKWAITIVLEEQEDGTYVAIRRAIVGEGNQYKITLEENQIAFVVHSGGSVPQNCLGSYENWMGKVVACSIRKGDVFQVDLTPGNLAVAAIGKLVETSSEESSAVSLEESVASVPEETSAEAESVVSETSVEQPVTNDTDYTGVVIVCIAVIVGAVVVIVAVAVKRKK